MPVDLGFDSEFKKTSQGRSLAKPLKDGVVLFVSKTKGGGAKLDITNTSENY